jgi:16S rRNA (uracil1498-N3)-methyltransferase
VVLAAGLLKGARWDFLVEKGTELGATHIVPLAGGRAVATTARRDRWTRIALAAAKQSLRARIPAIDAPCTVEGLLGAWPRAHVFVAEEGASAGAPATRPPAGDLLLVVGPEGGIPPPERERLMEAGARGVSLGPRRLRSETAALAMLALFSPLFDPVKPPFSGGIGAPERP